MNRQKKRKLLKPEKRGNNRKLTKGRNRQCINMANGKTKIITHVSDFEV